MIVSSVLQQAQRSGASLHVTYISCIKRLQTELEGEHI